MATEVELLCTLMIFDISYVDRRYRLSFIVWNLSRVLSPPAFVIYTFKDSDSKRLIDSDHLTENLHIIVDKWIIDIDHLPSYRICSSILFYSHHML